MKRSEERENRLSLRLAPCNLLYPEAGNLIERAVHDLEDLHAARAALARRVAHDCASQAFKTINCANGGNQLFPVDNQVAAVVNCFRQP